MDQLPQTEYGAQKSEIRKRTFLSRLQNDLKKPRFYIEVLALLIVGAYTYQAKTANDLTRKALGAVFDLSDLEQQEFARGIVEGKVINEGKVTARDVHGTITLTRHARNNAILTQNTTRNFGGRNQAVVPDGNIRFMVELKPPRPTGTTLGEDWKQLLGDDIVKVVIRLKYDDGYGNPFEQDWCRAVVLDNEYPSFVECTNLPALLAREAVTPAQQK